MPQLSADVFQPSLLQSRDCTNKCRNVHAAHEIDLAVEKKEKCEDIIVQCELNNASMEKEDFGEKKSEVKQKQKEADTLVAEVMNTL